MNVSRGRRRDMTSSPNGYGVWSSAGPDFQPPITPEGVGSGFQVPSPLWKVFESLVKVLYVQKPGA
ncbi:hypothetical protein HDE77_003698 [Rhodanobacter sp. MP7CTX1]|nr:hypothetical protein [Rhodanobacter sp. MP7CTX1]